MACGCGCARGAHDDATLALAQTSAGGLWCPSTMGDLLPTVVWPSDVEAYKRKLDPQWSSTNASAVACAKLPPAQLAAWTADYKAWQAFSAEGSCIFGCANKYDEAKGFEQRLASWQDVLTASGCSLSTPKANPPPSSDEAIKWVAGAAIVVAIVYGITRVIR